jgi:hypothetical protein
MADVLSESFLVRMPLWYLVHRGTAEVNAPTDPITLGVSIGHILLKLDWGDGTALAMFTDERKAGEFAAASGMTGLLSTRVATAPQFQELLVRLDPDTTHVGFDPPPPGDHRGRAPVVPVAEVLATLRGLPETD